MTNKMSQNKQEFMAKMVCQDGDYRRNPQASIDAWNRLTNKQKRNRFHLKPQHFFEAAWMLRDYLNIDNRFCKYMDGIEITYLDGEEKRHISATFDIYKNKELVSVLFLSNASDSVKMCMDGKRFYFGPDKHMTVKEFYRAIREAKDFIKAI